jgi:hypothetical protein
MLTPDLVIDTAEGMTLCLIEDLVTLGLDDLQIAEELLLAAFDRLPVDVDPKQFVAAILGENDAPGATLN